MKLAYFDCFSGISGDMILGAMVDAGLDLRQLRIKLSGLKIKGYELKSRRVTKNGIAATKLDVIAHEKQIPLDNFRSIQRLIQASRLEDAVKEQAVKVFHRLAMAEAKMHAKKTHTVRFFDIGHMDTVVDVIGALLGLRLLGIDKIFSSPIATGTGLVRTSHGLLPVPPPITAELLKGVPILSSDIRCELATPTGAAILTTLAEEFGSLPMMTVAAVGYGAGSHDLRVQPNLLRIFIGHRQDKWIDVERVVLLETNIDDMNPQIYDYLMGRLFAQGALDVYLTPILMKKGRPATLLSILSEPDKIQGLMEIVFAETTTLGLRLQEVTRRKLLRESRLARTPWGNVHVKVATMGKKVIKMIPEMDDCKRIAEETGFPLVKIMEAVHKSFGKM
jgi:pyridinium-3,5-bisthiocarboxylic acid mononucleotide nickel chelatase